MLSQKLGARLLVRVDVPAGRSHGACLLPAREVMALLFMDGAMKVAVAWAVVMMEHEEVRALRGVGPVLNNLLCFNVSLDRNLKKHLPNESDMPRQRKFYFVLISEDTDNKLYPNSFRGRELGEFLRLLDEMISSSISGQLGTDFGGLRIEGISRGSTCVSCCATEKQLIAFTSVSDEINRGRYKTGKVRQSIEKIRAFSTSYSARLEFRSKRHGPPLATLVPLTREQTTMPPLSISTDTTLYGKISGINGVSKVRVTLSLLGFNGNTDFVVTNKNDVREFCNRFGEIVGVNGTAEVRLPQREIVNFTFASLTDYQDVPLSDAVQNIRNKFGNYFNDICNIEELIREQRG